jgi:hypothetical protein
MISAIASFLCASPAWRAAFHSFANLTQISDFQFRKDRILHLAAESAAEGG